MRLPVDLVVEKRTEDYPKWLPAATSLAAVILAFIISGVILALIGGDPIRVGGFFWTATFGSVATISDTLVKATPLILVGLACSVAFRMKLWNIGAEGQFYMGAFFASLVVLVPILPPDAPKALVLLSMGVMGMIGGAIWGFVPGFLKAKFAVSEIITTLMLNYVAILWNNFWIFDRWSEGGFQMTRLFERVYWLPRLADYAREYPTLSGITLHLGFIVALIAAVAVWWIFDRSRWGYEIKLIGDNPNAARYAGLNIARNIILVMMLSGALGGVGGHVRDHWRGASPPGAHIAPVRLHRHHHRVGSQAQPLCCCPCFDPVRRVDRRWQRDPAIWSGPNAARHHPLHGH